MKYLILAVLVVVATTDALFLVMSNYPPTFLAINCVTLIATAGAAAFGWLLFKAMDT
jgi:hypothetical protein